MRTTQRRSGVRLSTNTHTHTQRTVLSAHWMQKSKKIKSKTRTVQFEWDGAEWYYWNLCIIYFQSANKCTPDIMYWVFERWMPASTIAAACCYEEPMNRIAFRRITKIAIKKKKTNFAAANTRAEPTEHTLSAQNWNQLKCKHTIRVYAALCVCCGSNGFYLVRTRRNFVFYSIKIIILLRLWLVFFLFCLLAHISIAQSRNSNWFGIRSYAQFRIKSETIWCLVEVHITLNAFSNRLKLLFESFGSYR